MRKCKACKGKGFTFVRASIFTGKSDYFFGMELPRIVDGMEKNTCAKCFGKGVK